MKWKTASKNHPSIESNDLIYGGMFKSKYMYEQTYWDGVNILYNSKDQLPDKNKAILKKHISN